MHIPALATKSLYIERCLLKQPMDLSYPHNHLELYYCDSTVKSGHEYLVYQKMRIEEIVLNT